MTVMAHQLESLPLVVRTEVKYLASPGGSGKTSSILPAFLNSVEKHGTKAFTHYLYVAFDNNKRHFRLSPPDPDPHVDTAEKQGAAFIKECVRILLESPGKEGPYEILRNDLPPSTDQSQKAQSAYFHKTFGVDKHVLIHLDEHAKMCEREGACMQSGACCLCWRVFHLLSLTACVLWSLYRCDLHQGGDGGPGRGAWRDGGRHLHAAAALAPEWLVWHLPISGGAAVPGYGSGNGGGEGIAVPSRHGDI
jgi:hypothetical protein